MSDHPCSCDTCTNDNCPLWIGQNLKLAHEGRLRHPIINGIATVGCFYHQKSREYLNEGLIEILEKRSRLFWHDLELVKGYQEAVKLLKEGKS